MLTMLILSPRKLSNILGNFLKDNFVDLPGRMQVRSGHGRRQVQPRGGRPAPEVGGASLGQKVSSFPHVSFVLAKKYKKNRHSLS